VLLRGTLPRCRPEPGPTSQVSFWRSLGGAIEAILGSILANRLPVEVGARVATLPHVPGLSGAGGAQALLDPARLARLRSSLPPSLLPTLDRFVEASRVALAGTLHDLFLIAAGVSAMALVATLFLREVPFARAADEPGHARRARPPAVATDSRSRPPTRR
jgi:hypothetical protein